MWAAAVSGAAVRGCAGQRRRDPTVAAALAPNTVAESADKGSGLGWGGEERVFVPAARCNTVRDGAGCLRGSTPTNTTRHPSSPSGYPPYPPTAARSPRLHISSFVLAEADGSLVSNTGSPRGSRAAEWAEQEGRNKGRAYRERQTAEEEQDRAGGKEEEGIGQPGRRQRGSYTGSPRESPRPTSSAWRRSDCQR